MAKSKKQESQEAPTETPAKAPTAGKGKAAAKSETKPDTAPVSAAPVAAAAEAPKAVEKGKKSAAAPAAKAVAAKPSPAKPATPATSKPAFPSIDTSLAAKAAANLLVNRDLLGGSAPGSKPEQQLESGSFRNLKQSLNQPNAGLNKALGIPGISGKKGPQAFGSFGGGGPRSQSGGGDAAKLGVPRRTNG